MSEDGRTLWVGNLDENVTEPLLYELFLQTGPMEKLIFVTEGSGENKRHTGQAFVVFKHPESVQYATQVLDGSSLFSQQLALKARSLPSMYKSSGNSSAGGRGRFDNSSLRTGFNKATTWHGQSDLIPRGRGNFRGRGGASNYNQNSGYNADYNNYNQGNSNNSWSGQQPSSDTQGSYAMTDDASMEDKRQKVIHQQNLQQGMANMTPQMYGVVQQQQPQQQGTWSSGGYNTGAWTGTGGDTTAYSGYNNRSGW
ncbi:unnamed protein product [Candidula unifasciata]|uniref:RRM domain-containing protein n=1 Tax=Candidula unifasciata TaxID=100452 RepID=A0A8S3ZUG9_9EUPU|nr:unnamed protein product [Candidula unifasciata]